MPAVDGKPQNRDLETLSADYESVATADDRVSWLDAGDAVDDAAGEFTNELPGPDGAPTTVRNPDGLHLCPAGSVRVAEAVLDWIDARWRVPAAPGWQDDDWALNDDGGIRESFGKCPAG